MTTLRTKNKSWKEPDTNLFRRVQVAIPVDVIRRANLELLLGSLLAPLTLLKSIRNLPNAVADLAALVASPQTLRDPDGAAEATLRKLLCKTGPDVTSGGSSPSYVGIYRNVTAMYMGARFSAANLLRIQSQTWTCLNIFYAGTTLVLDFDFGEWALSRHDVDEDLVEIIQDRLEVLLEVERRADTQQGWLDVAGSLISLEVTTSLYPSTEDVCKPVEAVVV